MTSIQSALRDPTPQYFDRRQCDKITTHSGVTARLVRMDANRPIRFFYHIHSSAITDSSSSQKTVTFDTLHKRLSIVLRGLIYSRIKD